MMNSVINNPSNMKAGTIIPWGSSSIPYGWLLCDGSAVSRTNYKALFNAIGTNYGSGDGSTTFNLPNGRICIGNAGIKGNGMSLGITDGNTNGGFYFDGSNNGTSRQNLYGTNVGSTGSGAAITGGSIGVTTDPTKSGLVIDSNNQTRAIIKY